MRLGGPILNSEYASPDEWIAALSRRGYNAAFCPVPIGAAPDAITAYRDAARGADIVIAEVGAWSSPLSDDPGTRKAGHEKCRAALALAEAIGARCCVNVAGSVGENWAGPDPRDLSAETFDRIVQSIRSIIDDVAPEQTNWAIEMMPFMLPDSADTYLELIEAIDRPRLAVHLDPVNIINSPRRYFDNAAVIRECFQKLGDRVVSCHAKDIILSTKLTVHLDECRPGTGALDYATYLQELDRLDPDTPLMLEHLPDQDEYAKAADHIRAIAAEVGISI